MSQARTVQRPPFTFGCTRNRANMLITGCGVQSAVVATERAALINTFHTIHKGDN